MAERSGYIVSRPRRRHEADRQEKQEEERQPMQLHKQPARQGSREWRTTPPQILFTVTFFASLLVQNHKVRRVWESADYLERLQY